MKMKYYLIWILAAAFGISSCYDDKGNYDYKNLTSIEIESFDGGVGFSLTLDDTLRITPRFTYSTPDTVMNLEYTWDFAGKVISKERNLVWVADTMATSYCTLKVEDKDNGVFFMQSASLKVGNKYQKDGYVVLGEKNGKSYLSFVPMSIILDEAGNIDSVSCKIVEGIYELENNESLGSDPIRVHEHYCATGANFNNSQLMIVQGGGSQLVDVNVNTFQKEVTGDQLFAGGWPSGLQVADVMFMRWCDLIQDKQGRLYSRVKSTDQLFHSEYFLPTPLKYEGEVMENMHIIPGKIEPSKFCLLYDGQHKRFLTLMDLDSYQEQALGKIVPLKEEFTEGGTYPQDFVPLENLGEYRLVHIGYIHPNYYTHIRFFMILEKAGKYYQQEFTIERDYSTSALVIMDMEFLEIPGGENVIGANSVVYVLPNEDSGKYVWISNGNRLYLYDRQAPSNGIKLFYTFDGNVTGMDSEVYRSRCLGVGLDNGRVAILRMENAKNLQTDEEKLLWITPEEVDLGHIKSIRYK